MNLLHSSLADPGAFPTVFGRADRVLQGLDCLGALDGVGFLHVLGLGLVLGRKVAQKEGNVHVPAQLPSAGSGNTGRFKDVLADAE